MSCSASYLYAQETDTATLGNGRFAVEVALDPAKTTALLETFGARFDQTACVRQITVKGRTFLFAPWGLIDEFGISGKGVPGYAQAAVGQSFLKIGIGALQRMDDKPFRFFKHHPITAAAPTTIVHRSDESLTLEQSARLGPWGYRYVKRYVVDADHATLRIEYQVTNIGQRAYPLEQYDHDWFHFAGTTIEPGYVVAPAFAVAKVHKNWLRQDDQGVLALTRRITKGSYFPSTLSSPASRNRLAVRNENGMAVVVTGDYRVARFALFADPRALCPEVFYGRDELAPGQSAKWTRTYRFITSFSHITAKAP